MVEILSPIAGADDPPKLKMVFFANTFPLAYHYAIALKRANNDKYKSLSEFIYPGVWGSPKSPKEDNLISYTNDDKNHNVPVTIFKPRYAFVPLTLAASRIRDDLLGKEDIQKRTPPPWFTISEFLEKAIKKYKIEDVVIYAEIADLGEYLKSFMEKTFPNPTVFAAQGPPEAVNLPMFRLIKPFPSMLRVFIYGGSLSSYLLRKKDRYLSLDIDNGNENVDGKKMKTYVSCPPTFAEPLKQYHEELYKAAKEAENYERNYERGCKTCPQFFTVYRSYNEMAWLLQHRSSFKEAEEFARCLRDHHQEVS